MASPREFFCRIPASLVKDPQLAPEAKLLYLVHCARADEHTGEPFVSGATIERLMGCCRTIPERAQRELVASGWLKLKRKPCARGRWGQRVYVLSFSRQAGQCAFPPQRSG